MPRRFVCVVLSLGACAVAVWLANVLHGQKPAPAWLEVAPGIWRTTAAPYGHALVADGHALLIDAPDTAAQLRDAAQVRQVDAVLLTHHHRDTCARAGELLAAKTPVRAPKASAQWLEPDAVKKFWQESIPLRSSNTAYFVVPAGLDGVDYSLTDGETVDWRGWTIQVIATPGHSRDHVAFAARQEKTAAPWLFCGDALAEPGKLWSPYVHDWDHWTDAGLTPAAKSLRKLAELNPRAVFPAHGEPIRRDAAAALEKTAANVEEVAFLKSFERFTKQRLGHAPDYAFLVPKEQVGSAGEKPWAKISEHVYITGNTYVLISKTDRAFAVIDPWGTRSAKQVMKLKGDLALGRLELAMFSHAHYDHYDGVYDLPGYERGGAAPGFEIWTLDQVAGPLAEPFRLRAPFLDARPVRFDRRLKDGEVATWREYQFRVCHLPGQSLFTMGLETTIDGKKCFFTADNFFHQDQYSGSGGWMGLNRSWPLPYAESAKKVLASNPDWILAEHGGPYEFNAEDYRRRVLWGEACARAADAVCLSGNHRVDWDPYRVQVVPLLQKAKAGDTVRATLLAAATRGHAETFTVTLDGRGLTADQAWTVAAPPGQTQPQEISLKLASSVPRGRHIFPLRVREASGADQIDGFFALDVE
jgi:glyoxylase-like metal-dependent hydrolase (beta-lactamase superfamily II)